jgi:hypothetical protein
VAVTSGPVDTTELSGADAVARDSVELRARLEELGA